MKAFGGILLAVAIVLIGFQIGNLIHTNYEWNNNFYSQWSLGEKASTIELKAQYVGAFYNDLASTTLAANDAYFLPTADNSSASNMSTLKSLVGRLDEIQTMDPNSFQYQTAISQITAQEQGGATDMLNVLEDTWVKANHPVVYLVGYNAWGLFLWFFELAAAIIGIELLAD